MLALVIVLSAAAALVLSAWLSVYLYGRFARRARGEPSHSLAISVPATPIDEMIAPLTGDHEDRTGLALVEDNLDAFALRALTARRSYFEASLSLVNSQVALRQADVLITGLLLSDGLTAPPDTEAANPLDTGLRDQALTGE